MTTTNCQRPRCERPHLARGLCSLHWQEEKRRKSAPQKLRSDLLDSEYVPHDFYLKNESLI
jgi:hypothetical protein